jgi:class 3 adenylate cyclase
MSVGCTVAEMQAADARGRLFALAGDRLIRPGRDRWRLAEVAERLHADPADVAAVWRPLGLVEPGEEPAASDADLAAVATVLDLAVLTGLPAALGVSRVIGGARARVADAVSAAVRVRVPELSLEGSDSELITARAYAQIAGSVPQLGALLDTVFRHHLDAARRQFESIDNRDVTAPGGIRLSVGFADLSGYSTLSAQLRLEELSALLTRFEEVACEVIAEHDARLVKFIGDAVMWVAATPRVGVQVATHLLEQARAHETVARAGVTTGVVLALDGDYFGPVVNLAARLVALAAPGGVLVDGPTATALAAADGGPWSATEPQPRQIRGFSEPVPVASLVAAGGPPGVR